MLGATACVCDLAWCRSLPSIDMGEGSHGGEGMGQSTARPVPGTHTDVLVLDKYLDLFAEAQRARRRDQSGASVTRW